MGQNARILRQNPGWPGLSCGAAHAGECPDAPNFTGGG